MSLINELEKLVAKASDKAADLEVYARDMSLLPAGCRLARNNRRSFCSRKIRI